MVIYDIKNYFMTKNVFEKVLEYIEMTGLLLRDKWTCSHASIYIRMLDTEERGKA